MPSKYRPACAITTKILLDSTIKHPDRIGLREKINEVKKQRC